MAEAEYLVEGILRLTVAVHEAMGEQGLPVRDPGPLGGKRRARQAQAKGRARPARTNGHTLVERREGGWECSACGRVARAGASKKSLCRLACEPGRVKLSAQRRSDLGNLG